MQLRRSSSVHVVDVPLVVLQPSGMVVALTCTVYSVVSIGAFYASNHGVKIANGITGSTDVF